MGQQQTKEEVIIAQAGNSGGVTTGEQKIQFSVYEILGLIAFVAVAIVVILFLCRKFKQMLEKKIRAEIRRSTSRSTEQV